jgi:hypothetical protein
MGTSAGGGAIQHDPALSPGTVDGVMHTPIALRRTMDKRSPIQQQKPSYAYILGCLTAEHP